MYMYLLINFFTKIYKLLNRNNNNIIIINNILIIIIIITLQNTNCL